MPTPFESAQLLLTLYDQRREPTMRKAREYFLNTFDPKTFDEMMATMGSPDNAYIRMVLGYWEMAASLVTNGAIDQKMFQDSTGEYIAVFAKLEPFLPKLREMFDNPGFGSHLERLTMSLPNARQRVDGTLQRIRAMTAARAAYSPKA
jgi:hypothetical protein